MNYSGEILMQAKGALDRLKTAKRNLEFISANGSGAMSEGESALVGSLPEYRTRFCAALDDDFNTADAISVIFELVREANSITAEPDPSKEFARAVLNVFNELTDVLGLIYGGEEESPDEEVEALIAARQAARSEKNWAEADAIRDKLAEMGVTLEDTPQGVKWRRS
jgi:cysteinyl-tRNA synthetase